MNKTMNTTMNVTFYFLANAHTREVMATTTSLQSLADAFYLYAFTIENAFWRFYKLDGGIFSELEDDELRECLCYYDANCYGNEEYCNHDEDDDAEEFYDDEKLYDDEEDFYDEEDFNEEEDGNTEKFDEDDEFYGYEEEYCEANRYGAECPGDCALCKWYVPKGGYYGQW